MLRMIAVIFGVGFVFAGVTGFLPMFMINGTLFNIFQMDGLHNIIYIVSGVLGIMAATSFAYTKRYFKLLGIVYVIAALLGFWWNGDLYLIQVNMADNILHLVIGIIALYLGFSSKKEQA